MRTYCKHEKGTTTVKKGWNPEDNSAQLYAKRVCDTCGDSRSVDVTPDAKSWRFSQEQWEAWWAKVYG